MTTEVIAEFADGEYRFWLAMPQVVAFERDHGSIIDFWGKLSEGIGIDSAGLFKFIGPSGPTVPAMRDLVRLALIGGDHGIVDGSEVEMGPIKAKQLVDEYCFPVRPIEELAALAFRIVDAAVRGVKLEGGQKKSPETSDQKPSAEEPSSQTVDS